MKVFRLFLRWYCKTFHVRGRHQLANIIGKKLAPSKVEILNIDGILLPVDHSIEMYRYIYYGMYEEKFISLLKRIIKPGDIIIEPGANIGYITAILSSLVGNNGKVFSLEPSRICFKKIINYLTKPTIILMNIAIADIDGELYFTDKERVITRGFSTFSKFTSKQDTDNEYLIPTIKVDTLISRYNLKHIKLLKLDVEGSELIALRGASQALMNNLIDYILVETSFISSIISTQEEINKLLISCGYSCYLMGNTKLIPYSNSLGKGEMPDVIWTCIKQ